MRKISGGLRIPLVVLLGFAVALGAWAVLRPEPSPVAAAGPGGQEAYPRAQFVLAEGEGKGLTVAYCTACHSLAPVVTHGGFTKETWAKTVAKMRTQYGAPIDDATAKQITAYLQEHYSAPPPSLAGTSRTPYSTPIGLAPAGDPAG
jgi:hypothetical protein